MSASDVKELLIKHENEARVANQHDKVYKDECVYSFDNPESENGLFICLNSFISVSKHYLPVHFSKTNSHLYLRTKTWRREIIQNTEDEPEKKKPSKLGIGVDGGFDLNEKQYYFDHDFYVYVYPENKEIKYDETTKAELPKKIRDSVESIIKAESVNLKEDTASALASWDGEKRFISKHSFDLLQLPDPVQISPNRATWKCENCDVKENLWLNLTDGKILCGRRQLDGSGGNNHAVEHYQKVKYPLAVKLGTITGKGADVYSYDEDDMVEDANLAIHLSHFGINMSKMEKTEKTMAELEIDLNQKVGEWDRIQESGSQLVPLFGPGYTGMRNLGNSCYMNSVMQLVFVVPDFLKKYYENRDSYLNTSSTDPSNSFNFQMSKLAYGLQSGVYSNKDSLSTNGIKPISFKSLVGRGHPEFSTKRQQDAHEFFLYLLNLVERNLRNDSNQINPVNAFKFQVEDRIECMQSHQVAYKRRDEYCLSLPISKDLAINKPKLAEYEQKKAELAAKGEKPKPEDLVRPEIRLNDCIELFKQDEIINDFYSSAVKSKVNAAKTTRFATFPDFLLIQAKKFEFSADWTPIKLDIALQVPDQIDLNHLRGTGLKPGEKELEGEVAQEEEIQLNENIVGQLVDMGFSLEGSKRAVYHTREANDSEAAVNWAVSHMEDSDFNHPFQIPSSKPKQSKPASQAKKYDEESINSIISFGFTRKQAIKALEATNNNLERAADWIFSHSDELMDTDDNESESASASTASASSPEYRDGNGTYKLVGFISHMGTNANVGHYVVHLLKDGKWTIFNDEKAALSENPPKELAYLYLYQRV